MAINDRIYDMALSMDQSLTPIEKIYLFSQFKSSRKILAMNIRTIKNLIRRRWTGKRFRADFFLSEAKKIFPYLEQAGIKTVRFDCPAYPAGLKEIPDLPFLLYYRGNISCDYNKTIAVIGTRQPDTAGIRRTEQYVSFLTRKGFTIISGLAHGIDGQAHRISISRHGHTIAVLGSGIDYIYPAVHKPLAREILTHKGGIISEHAPGMTPKKWYFPRRNRIIVGMCRSVLIIQSPKKSGTLISANLAADYNRDLLVLSPQNKEIDAGNLDLIQLGATEIRSPSELLLQFIY